MDAREKSVLLAAALSEIAAYLRKYGPFLWQELGLVFKAAHQTLARYERAARAGQTDKGRIPNNKMGSE